MTACHQHGVGDNDGETLFFSFEIDKKKKSADPIEKARFISFFFMKPVFDS
jgi:hypothetical protein